MAFCVSIIFDKLFQEFQCPGFPRTFLTDQLFQDFHGLSGHYALEAECPHVSMVYMFLSARISPPFIDEITDRMKRGTYEREYVYTF